MKAIIRDSFKNRSLICVLLFLFFLLFGCANNSDDSGSDESSDKSARMAGDSTNHTAGSVSFNMIYLPGGLTFSTGTTVDGTADVSNNYLTGQTEVTYELWEAVRTWAESGSAGTAAGNYTFTNNGVQGSDGSQTDQHPVTTINWRESMVWTNALTEFYNAQNGTNLEPVYTFNSSIIRDSQDSNDTTCDNAVASPTANGFRLLTSNEWDLAARYITDDDDSILNQPGESYPGDFVSGADVDYNYNDATTDVDFDGDGDYQISSDVAVFDVPTTAVVRSKSPNALGLYDMSGNVWEWTFDEFGPTRIYRGNAWDSLAISMRMGYVSGDFPINANGNVGFRFARTP